MDYRYEVRHHHHHHHHYVEVGQKGLPHRHGNFEKTHERHHSHHSHHVVYRVGMEWHRFLMNAGLWMMAAWYICCGIAGMAVAMDYPFFRSSAMLLMLSGMLVLAGIGFVLVHGQMAALRRNAPDQLLVLQIAAVLLCEMMSFVAFGWFFFGAGPGIALAVANRCYYARRQKLFVY